MRRPLDDSIHIQMTLKLALSLGIFIATTVAGAITWSYGFGQNIIAQTDQRRELRLQAYPSSMQLQKLMEDIENEQHTDYMDLRNRIDTIRSLVYHRTSHH